MTFLWFLTLTCLQSESQRATEAVRSVREKMKELGEEARTKEALHRQLAADCEKLTKDISRWVLSSGLGISTIICFAMIIKITSCMLFSWIASLKEKENIFFFHFMSRKIINVFWNRSSNVFWNRSSLTVLSRSAYTRRILEIIGNIRKQKEEIERVLADTRQVQKEINQLTGRLDRSFAVADELIFKVNRSLGY